MSTVKIHEWNSYPLFEDPSPLFMTFGITTFQWVFDDDGPTGSYRRLVQGFKIGRFSKLRSVPNYVDRQFLYRRSMPPIFFRVQRIKAKPHNFSAYWLHVFYQFVIVLKVEIFEIQRIFRVSAHIGTTFSINYWYC